LIIQGVPNLSLTMPKRFAQKVSAIGMPIAPPRGECREDAVGFLGCVHVDVDGIALRLAEAAARRIRAHDLEIAQREAGVRIVVSLVCLIRYEF
jgi:hypothetical protein